LTDSFKQAVAVDECEVAEESVNGTSMKDGSITVLFRIVLVTSVSCDVDIEFE
jgi:hypothetical protein